MIPTSTKVKIGLGVSLDIEAYKSLPKRQASDIKTCIWFTKDTIESLPSGSSSYDLIKKFCWKTSPPCDNFPLNVSMVLSSCLAFHWSCFGLSTKHVVGIFFEGKVGRNTSLIKCVGATKDVSMVKARWKYWD